jgi:hypothetical protein
MDQAAQVLPMTAQALAPQSDSAVMIHMLERAMRDVSVPMDRLERMMAMANEVRAQQAKEQFNVAMAAAQAGLRAVSADADNPQTRSKYASYAKLDRAVRPVYGQNGFSLSFNTEPTAAESTVRVVCEVAHTGGHSRMYGIDMPADGKGAKGGDVMTKTHATGSAVTYGRRYLLQMIFNIAVGDDDDGNAAGRDDKGLDAKQVLALQALIARSGSDIQAFYAYASKFAGTPIVKLEDIPQFFFEKLKDKLLAKINTDKGGK